MKKWIWIGASLGIIGLLVFASNSSSKDSGEPLAAQTVVPQQILAEVESGQASLLDVRSQVEFDLAHAANSDLFNVEWLKIGQLPDIEKDQKIYVYCRSGNRSAEAKQILEASGFNNVVDLGGFNNWMEGGGPTSTTELPPYTELLAQMGAKPLPALGNADAPLTVVKYADFQCPYCARFTLETEPQIIREYVETGRIRYEYRNVAYLGDESALAAIGSYCANEQNGFWAFHNVLTQSYAQNGEAAFAPQALEQVASGTGLDGAVFSDCLTSGKYDSVVSSETISAQNEGFDSTPSFQVGSQKLNGALPFNSFQGVIDSQL